MAIFPVMTSAAAPMRAERRLCFGRRDVDMAAAHCAPAALFDRYNFGLGRTSPFLGGSPRRQPAEVHSLAERRCVSSLK
jgi:hypothetical protein